MATDTGIVFYGLSHLAGKRIQVCLAGIDCGDFYPASDGSITVPFGNDAGGIFTAAYVAALTDFDGEQAVPVSFVLDDVTTDVTISAVFGEGYTSRGQLLRAATAQDINSTEGAALGKKRRVNKVAALLQENGPNLSFGTSFSDMRPVEFRAANEETLLVDDEMFSGVFWTSGINDGDTFDGMLCWEVTRPGPCTIVAVSAFQEAES